MNLKLPLGTWLLSLASVMASMASLTASAQTGFFEPVSSAQARVAAPATQDIKKYVAYQLKTAELRTYLAKAPLEFHNNGATLRLEIPLPNGTVEPFAMLESPILAPAIAAQYPDIKTYTGRGLSHPAYTIRLSFTSSGFDAIILGVDGDAAYYTKAAANDPTDRTYLTYFARNVKKNDEPQPFGTLNRCGITGEGVKGIPDKTDKQGRLGSALNNTGATLRTFRLAVAATGEFTQRRGGTVQNAFNSLVGYVNRMNAVYRTELSVAFTLVTGANLVYPDPNTDPYTNSSTSTMLGENQNNLDKEFKNENYDIGHVFGYAGSSGGGIASKGSVCVNNRKGQGVSNVGNTSYGTINPNQGVYAPVFDDQLITHEVGHQFGMDHTFNSIVPVCTTRNADTSVEPGSGATIMSYGFTCGGQTGDDYEGGYQPFLNFHTVSYEQATTFINTLTCFTSTPLNNAVPVIGQFPANVTIPKSTPFELTGTATDDNAGDVLSYSWEGTNIGTIVPTTTTFLDTSQPPFFRSYQPASTGTRTFPRLSAILDGTNMARGDKLPSVGIGTTHRLTVRDNAGGLTYREATVTIDGNSGPFLETTNLSGTYPGNSVQTITWSVNNTNQAPVNCATVNILLSTDGGLTFPTTLLANTPNDGTEPVTLPLVSVNQGRIKVMAANNVFFDISNANFSITNPANQPPVAVVIPNQTGTLDTPLTFTIPAFTDPENQPLTYTAIGLPTSLTLNPTTRVISGIPGSVGTSTVTIVATDPGNATASAAFTLTLNPIPLVPLIVSTSTTPTTFLTTGTIVVTTTVSGGRPPYRYDYSANRSLAALSSSGNRVTFSDVTAGVQSLSVVVTDNSQPVNQTATATISVTVTDPAGTPVVKVNSTDPIAAEGRPGPIDRGRIAAPSRVASATDNIDNDDPGYIRFVRSSGAGSLVVNYQIGGTATNGVDFLSLPTSITFAPGQTEYIEEMDPIDDDIVEGDESVVITLIDEPGYDPDPAETTTTLTIRDNVTSPFGITGVTIVSCVTLSAGQRQIKFTPQYTGISGQPISFQVVNELSPTTASGPYTLNLYIDNPTITLRANQSGTAGQASFSYNWLAACNGNVTPPPTPASPFSITGVTTVSCTTISAGQRQIKFTPQYAGINGQPVSFSVVNEMLPTTAPGPYTLNPYTDNPTLRLRATQSGTAGEASFSYNWLAACTGNVTPPPTPASPFSITGVTTVSCTTISAGQRQIKFTPRYAGVSGQPISFSVVNELLPTTASGPYTLNLYTDNPVITLKAVQSGTAGEASFTYNWLAACNGGSGRIGASAETVLEVQVLGNPAQNGQVVVEVRGAAGQPLRVILTDMRGQVIATHQIEQAGSTEKHTFELGRQGAGLLLLRASTPTQSQTVKVIKAD